MNNSAEQNIGKKWHKLQLRRRIDRHWMCHVVSSVMNKTLFQAFTHDNRPEILNPSQNCEVGPRIHLHQLSLNTPTLRIT